MNRIFLSCAFMFGGLTCFCQQKALNIPAIHQLVSASKSENKLQKDAKNKQVITTANEEQNKTLLAKLKIKYRTLQQRYQVLGTVIDVANIGIQATPMVSHIVRDQAQIFQLARNDPALIALAYQAEIAFADKAHSLVNYLVGLSASIGAINQMKASDRKMLFDEILFELSAMQELSANLLNAMQYSNTAGMVRSLNPFRDYIDQDKAIVSDIILNAKYLKE